VDDEQVRRHIEDLVAEEHRLWDAESAGAASPDDRRRLQEVKVSLDRCWDLLRQRHALEEFGMDPDAAATRDAETVENYEQ
jgi:Protein of unknown function (DUF2630)